MKYTLESLHQEYLLREKKSIAGVNCLAKTTKEDKILVVEGSNN
jgi:hypothetical protein